jgi:signal peptidase I
MSQLGDNANALGCELAGEIVRTFGRVRVRVTGMSMIPAVWPGDVLVVERRAAEKIERGEIAVAEHDGRLVAHRVVAGVSRADAATELRPASVPGFTMAGLITRGDAQLFADKSLRAEELLGTVVSIERGAGARQPRRKLGTGARMLAAMARRSSTAARVFVRLHAIFTARPERVALCKS